MKKMKKRYYMLIVIAAITMAVTINEFNSVSFEIVKSSTAYAPENDIIQIPESAMLSRVNINTADIRLLSTIDGVGESIAERIIKYRTKNGKFEVIQDIMKVEGIGEKKFDAMKDYITVE